MLPSPTLSKLLRDCFAQPDSLHDALIDIPVSNQKEWFTKLAARLQSIPRTTFRVLEDRHGNDTIYLSIKLEGVSTKTSPDDWFQIQFMTVDNCSGLHIADASYRRRIKLAPAPVRSIEQLEQFFAAVQARQERDHLRTLKTEKLVGFQKKGLTARLRELGKQHNFAFVVNENTRDIQLSIRIKGRKSGYHFSFVKTKLEGMLEQLPELVSMLQKMQSLGIQFTTANKMLKRSMQTSFDWIEPNEEQTE
jgi:hypothetical protein